jgi:hypothetical protein
LEPYFIQHKEIFSPLNDQIIDRNLKEILEFDNLDEVKKLQLEEYDSICHVDQAEVEYILKIHMNWREEELFGFRKIKFKFFWKRR